MDNSTLFKWFIAMAKITFLTLALWFSFVNFGKLYRGHAISSRNFLVQSWSIAMFVYLQWIM